MKNNVRKLISLMAVFLFLASFSAVAYAGGGPEDEPVTTTYPIVTESPEPSATPEPTPTPTPEPTASPKPAPSPEPLTPEGNMTLVDDIDGTASEDKQFITVVTKNGNYFYIIIDRAADGENTVHFLNQVDEADLMALMEEDGAAAEETPAVCSCTDKCVAGDVNTSCPICKVDMTKCAGKEPAPTEPQPTPPVSDPEPEEKGGGSAIVVILILALAGGGAFYYFKVMKKTPNKKGHSDLDDYDFGDDDDDVEDEPNSIESEIEDIDYPDDEYISEEDDEDTGG